MNLNLEIGKWRKYSLGEIACASKEKVDPNDGNVSRYIAGEHMYTDDLKIHRWGDIDEVELGPAFHRRFRPGQVLYGSRRTYLRKVAVAEFDGVCANTTFALETANQQVLLQEFLPFILSSEPFHAFAIAESKGSVNPYVNWSDIARYEFALPPLKDQKRIANLLWAVELHKRNLADLLDEKEQLRRATFTQLINSIGFKTHPLGSHGSFTRGRRFTKTDYVSEGLACVHYAQIHTNFGLEASSSLTYVPETMRSSLRIARQGDLLVAGTSEDVKGVGKAVAWLGSDVAVHDDCFIYSHDMEPRFASYLFASSEFFTEKLSYISKSKVVRISASDLAKMLLPIPSAKGQQVIVEEMKKIESLMATLNAEISRLNEVRQGISAAIFGGQR